MTAGKSEDGRVYRFAFVIEPILGHRAHADNLQRCVAHDSSVNSHWILPPFEVAGAAARIPVYRSNWTLRCGVRTRRSLKQLRRGVPIDALFFHTHVPGTLSRDYIRRTPTVISIDATPLQYDEFGDFYEHASGPAVIERLKWSAARSVFHAASRLVTWSDWARISLIEDYGVPPEKVIVIPPGVAMDRWRRATPRVADGTTKILFVGADLARKGGHDLIEAFRAVRPLGAELHLVTRDDVAPEPGITVHHGLTPNSEQLVALYHECDVFALPTYGDCLPMVLSEAGAAGMPAISTSVAAIPEIVIDGDTGLVIRPGDVSALADALRRLIERPDERRAMGQRAAAHAAQNYDTAANTAQLVSVMKEIARSTTADRSVR